MRAPSARALGLLAFQFAGGIAGIIVWAILSQTELHLVDDASRALAIGMIVYLPLTLGLPFVLPNFYRGHAPQPAGARLSIALVVACATSSLVVGAVLRGLSADTWALACTFAGLVAGSAALQQVSRIRRNLATMACSSIYNVALPGGVLLAHFLGSGTWLTQAVMASLACVVLLLLLRERQALAKPAPSEPVPSVIRLAVPLVPHMLAFAVITQGLRIPFAAADLPMAPAHTVMLFVGLSLAVIMGINSLLAVGIQMAPESEVRAATRRNVPRYLTLGAAGFVGMLLTYGTPVRAAFGGSEPLSWPALLALCAIPTAYSVYFLGTVFFLRYGRSLSLAAVSIPAAALYLGVSIPAALMGATLGAQVAIYAATIAVMAGWVVFFGFRMRGEDS